ncbi:MAG: hypothetical protein AB7P02_09170 [Alphaproteobacteria bacterium]
MKGLADLIRDPDGRAFLHEAGIFLDPAAFLAAVAPMGGPCAIYTHQQPSADFRRSVVAKIAALDAVKRLRPEAVDAVFVLIDTDRAESSKAATRISWRHPDGRVAALKVTPPGSGLREFRHVELDPAQLSAIAARLAAWLRQLPGGREAAEARLAALLPTFLPTVPVALGQWSASVAAFLLAAHLDARPRMTTVSLLADRGTLAAPLAALMGARDAFVAAVDRRVAELHGAGIETAVSTLPADYLPLFHSCPADGTRLRLRLRRQGGDRHATAQCRCGRRYDFPLGPRGQDMEALFATGRWSPDVTLPVLLNGSFSGMVAGRSSALYSLVLGAAMREALGTRPVPILVPAALAAAQPGPDGLLQSWLTG